MGFFLQNFLDAKKKQMVFSETEKSEWVFLKPKKAKEKEKAKAKTKTKTKTKTRKKERVRVKKKKKKKEKAEKGLCTHPLSIPFLSSFSGRQKNLPGRKTRLGGSILMA